MTRAIPSSLLAAAALVVVVVAMAGDAPVAAAPPQEPEEAAPMTRPTNRLAQESSPYLLQHAHNPVDWYPWGDEAFEKARREDKPVFLSIGYSTCHWCHVMERESFEDEETARFLNENFVSIKVDREERPDVDAVHMQAVQALTGQGGWPLSVFLTPDRRPFFGGTYFPPEERLGRPSFRNILERLTEVWKARREDVYSGADSIVKHLREAAEGNEPGEVTAAPLARAVEQFRGAFDPTHGGFGNAPKFPRAHALSFLLAQARLGAREAAVVPMVTQTLEHMRRGGVHDHLGGGFHRYSTDAEWLVPHFEKMLYDQALLSRAYVEAWKLTGDAHFAATARDTFEYVLRDLLDPAGGFRSAEDADSEGVEGKFYVWTRAEIVDVLGEEDGALFANVYGVEERGNFHDEATHQRSGANILFLETPIEAEAKKLAIDAGTLESRLASLRAKLLEARGRRVRPSLDDKVLTDWNGLMIGSFACGGAALREPRYLDGAIHAAEFVLREMRTDAGLLHRWRDGHAGIGGFLDDYAYLALGLADLYEATFDAKWLRAAKEIAHEMVVRFRDDEHGGFHLASRSAEQLVARTKDLYDGATPSGNSAAMLALVRVGRLTGDEELEAEARRALAAWARTLDRYPMGYPTTLSALSFAVGPAREVVIAGAPADRATRALVSEVRRRFLANTVVLLHPPGDAGAAIREVAPFLAAQGPVDGKPAAYVCEAHACKAPVTSAAELGALLDAR